MPQTKIDLDQSIHLPGSGSFVSDEELSAASGFLQNQIDGINPSGGGSFPALHNIVYVGKNGSNSNDGSTPDNAFLTFEAALANIESNSPGEDNHYSAVCLDAGVYDEFATINVPQFTTVLAKRAKIRNAEFVLNNRSSVDISEFYSPSGIKANNCHSGCFFKAEYIHFAGYGFELHSENSNLHIDVESIIVGISGISTTLPSIALYSTNGSISAKVNNIILASNNAIGVFGKSSSSYINLVGNSIYSLTNNANQIALSADNGANINAYINSILLSNATAFRLFRPPFAGPFPTVVLHTGERQGSVVQNGDGGLYYEIGKSSKFDEITSNDITSITATFTRANQPFQSVSGIASTTINWTNGNNVKLSIGTNITTLNLNNPRDGERYMLEIIHDGSGPYSIAWPSGSIYWRGGVAPSASGIDAVTMVYDGSRYLADIGYGFATV